MPTIRILRGSFRDESGEKAEPGDVITVDEDTLERLTSPSYELVEDEAETAVEPATEEEPASASASEPGPETEPQNSTDDEPVGTEPVSSAESEDEAEAEAEAESEAVETPKGASSEDVGDQTPTPDVPDDYAMLSKMAAIYESDEVHGSMSGDEITQFLESLSPTEVNGLKRQAKQEME